MSVLLRSRAASSVAHANPAVTDFLANVETRAENAQKDVVPRTPEIGKTRFHRQAPRVLRRGLPVTRHSPGEIDK